jgi:schlafen family protein
MVHAGQIVLHPAEQVRGYVEYCRRFHSAVQDHAAEVKGCVLFTGDYFAERYGEPPNERLVREYPCFTLGPHVVREALAAYLVGQVSTPDLEFARDFVEGHYRRRILDFRVVDTPFALESALRERIAAGRTARLVASYAREWKTKDAARPHALPGAQQDFHERYVMNGQSVYWDRVWNFIPQNGSDYSWFIQAPPGSPMHDDPLCEIGCLTQCGASISTTPACCGWATSCAVLIAGW